MFEGDDTSGPVPLRVGASAYLDDAEHVVRPYREDRDAVHAGVDIEHISVRRDLGHVVKQVDRNGHGRTPVPTSLPAADFVKRSKWLAGRSPLGAS